MEDHPSHKQESSDNQLSATHDLSETKTTLTPGFGATEHFAQSDEIDQNLARRFKLAAIAVEALVFVAGTLGAIGWAFNIDALKHPTDEPALQSASSISFILLSVSVLLLCAGSARLWRNLTARLLAAIVIVASAAAFIDHTCHVHLGDLVLWRSNEESFGLTYPGPLLPHESLCFLLLGLGAVLFNVVPNQKFFPSQILAVLVGVPGFIVLCCYMFGQSHLCINFGCTQLSPIFALVALMSAMGLFFAAPDSGGARLFSLKSTPGILARRACVGLSIMVAALLPRQWLIAVGESTQLFDEATVNVGTATVAVLALGTFVWWCLRKIEVHDTQTQQVIQEKSRTIEMMQMEADALEPKLKMVCLECMGEFLDTSLTHCPNDQSSLIAITDALSPGTTFDERYKIVKELGSGGISTVYLAEHLLMHKQVAVKVLQTQFATDPKTIQRFQRESQAASSLSHPNLVGVYDFSVTKTGQAYMVMEFLEGISLSALLSRGQPMPWRDAIPIFLEVCNGLDHAHSKGVIHRDLKPGNIMLLPSVPPDRRFTPKIVDFGLAKIWDKGGMQLTHTGEIFGSPLYMSPEQCRGQAMDPRSDIYALGCIMYATLTGNPPFQGASALETFTMHLNDALPAIPPNLDVPEWLVEIARKATAKDPAQRFQKVAEIRLALCEHPPKAPHTEAAK